MPLNLNSDLWKSTTNGNVDAASFRRKSEPNKNV